MPARFRRNIKQIYSAIKTEALALKKTSCSQLLRILHIRNVHMNHPIKGPADCGHPEKMGEVLLLDKLFF